MKAQPRRVNLDSIVEVQSRRAVVLGRIGELPSSPRLAAEIDKILQDPDCSILEIEARLAEDQALVAKLLRLVNSAYYAPREPVCTLARAIALAGRRTVRNLLYALTTSPLLAQSLPAYGYEEEGLWQHSLATAVTAQALAKEIECRSLSPDEYFVVGLVHDVAKLVLGEFLSLAANNPPGSSDDRVATLEDERRITGFDHAELGRIIAEKWNFPREFSIIIGAHHSPLDATEHAQGAALVCLADDITHRLGVGYRQGLAHPTGLSNQLPPLLGLDPGRLAAIITELPEMLAEAGSLFSGADLAA